MRTSCDVCQGDLQRYETTRCVECQTDSIICPNCEESGQIGVDIGNWMTCPECFGSGRVLP